MKWVSLPTLCGRPLAQLCCQRAQQGGLATAANRGDDGRKTAAGCGREANAGHGLVVSNNPINLRVLLCGCYSVVQMVAALLGHFCCGHTSIALLGQRARGKPKDIKTIH